MNHALVVLDPAHGGPDSGARLGDQLVEKDFTLAFALRLRAALQTAGFTVLTIRDSDPTVAFPTDQRAEIANRSHAVACLVLHATATGSGVHVYASALQPTDSQDPATGTPPARVGAAFEPVPWGSAQAPSVRQSLRLESDVAAAIGVANLPLVAGRASVRPLDNLTCPAVAVELAPLIVEGQDTVAVNDAGYQQHVANALTRALLAWRGHADPAAPAHPAPLDRPTAGASR
jgi:N-acetylmuramoyl-L-alanine amidase